MVHHIKMKQFLDCVLNVLNSRVAKLHHFATVGANKVIVLFVAVGFFVLGKILTKLMLAHQITFYQ